MTDATEADTTVPAVTPAPSDTAESTTQAPAVSTEAAAPSTEAPAPAPESQPESAPISLVQTLHDDLVAVYEKVKRYFHAGIADLEALIAKLKADL